MHLDTISRTTMFPPLSMQFVLSPPGCGHCKALVPTYEEVATTFRNDEGVSVCTLCLGRHTCYWCTCGLIVQVVAELDAHRHRDVASK